MNHSGLLGVFRDLQGKQTLLGCVGASEGLGLRRGLLKPSSLKLPGKSPSGQSCCQECMMYIYVYIYACMYVRARARARVCVCVQEAREQIMGSLPSAFIIISILFFIRAHPLGQYYFYFPSLLSREHENNNNAPVGGGCPFPPLPDP